MHQEEVEQNDGAVDDVVNYTEEREEAQPEEEYVVEEKDEEEEMCAMEDVDGTSQVEDDEEYVIEFDESTVQKKERDETGEEIHDADHDAVEDEWCFVEMPDAVNTK